MADCWSCVSEIIRAFEWIHGQHIELSTWTKYVPGCCPAQICCIMGLRLSSGCSLMNRNVMLTGVVLVMMKSNVAKDIRQNTTARALERGNLQWDVGHQRNTSRWR